MRCERVPPTCHRAWRLESRMGTSWRDCGLLVRDQFYSGSFVSFLRMYNERDGVRCGNSAFMPCELVRGSKFPRHGYFRWQLDVRDSWRLAVRELRARLQTGADSISTMLLPS